MKLKRTRSWRTHGIPIWAAGALFTLLSAGCVSGSDRQDDDSSSIMGDDDTTHPAEGDDDSSVADGDDSPARDDDATAAGDDDATAADDDDTTVTGDDDTTVTDDDDTTAAGDDDVTSAGDDDATFVGDDDATDGDDDASTMPEGADSIPMPPLPPGNWMTGVMLVSDTGGGDLSVIRMADSARLWLYQLNTYMSDKCSGSHPCQTFEANHVVHDDRDYVDFAMSSGSNLQSSVHRIAMDDPGHPIFSLTGLDFSKVPHPNCTLPPSQTCNPNTQGLPPQCMISFTHGLQVVEDDTAAQKASVIVTDSQDRILQIDLNYAGGNTCGEVQWVLDFSSPTWDVSCPPNNVQYIQDHGNEYLGVTCRNLFGSTGEGQIQLFKGSGTGVNKTWRRIWTFPDPNTSGATPYLNLPHHAVFLPYGDGSYYMMYAHSDGLSSAWAMGDHGTMGSAWLSSLEGQPDYLADEGIAVESLNPRFGFLKSVELLPGGSRLVVDSGSFTVQPPVPGTIYVIGPQSIKDNSMPGYWSPQHVAQNLSEVGRSVDKVYACNWPGLYEADWLGYESFGSFLRTVINSPGSSCDMSVPPPPGGSPIK